MTRGWRRWCATILRASGFAVDIAGDVATGVAALRARPAELLILDLMLPDGDGLDVCRRLRADGVGIPILMLTAKGDPIDRVIGLEIGADDYLPKPFEPRELQARIKALLRRAAARPRIRRCASAASRSIATRASCVSMARRGR